jgi:hypothetical protein
MNFTTSINGFDIFIVSAYSFNVTFRHLETEYPNL